VAVNVHGGRGHRVAGLTRHFEDWHVVAKFHRDVRVAHAVHRPMTKSGGVCDFVEPIMKDFGADSFAGVEIDKDVTVVRPAVAHFVLHGEVPVAVKHKLAVERVRNFDGAPL